MADLLRSLTCILNKRTVYRTVLGGTNEAEKTEITMVKRYGKTTVAVRKSAREMTSDELKRVSRILQSGLYVSLKKYFCTRIN